MRFEACPCCGASDFYDFYCNPQHKEVTTAHEFAYGGSSYIRRLTKCRVCAYAFSDDACEDYFRFYTMDKTTVVDDSQAGKKRYFQSVIRMAGDVLTHTGAAIRGDKSLLDIGAGNGAFINELVKAGFAGPIDAVELNDQSSRNLLATARNVYSTIEHCSAAGSRYDVITMFDFLEHVLDPRHFLQGLQGISHADTVYIIGVPRMDSLISRMLGHKYWLYTPMHYSYFSRPGLQALLGSLFTSVSIEKSPWETGPLSGALKWLGFDIELAGDISITVPHASSYICVCSDRISL